MCRSVPQIEAARTRTSTSSAPIAGMATDSSCAPRSGRTLRRAFIVVVGMEKPRDELAGLSAGRRQLWDVSTRAIASKAATKTDDEPAGVPLQSARLIGAEPDLTPTEAFLGLRTAAARDPHRLPAGLLGGQRHRAVRAARLLRPEHRAGHLPPSATALHRDAGRRPDRILRRRSEEHTSELSHHSI